MCINDKNKTNINAKRNLRNIHMSRTKNKILLVSKYSKGVNEPRRWGIHKSKGIGFMLVTYVSYRKGIGNIIFKLFLYVSKAP